MVLPSKPVSHEETVVLAACMVLIGVCSITAVILLLQEYGRRKAESPAPATPLSRRRGATHASAAYYRPLSDQAKRGSFEHTGLNQRRAAATRHREADGALSSNVGTAALYLPGGATATDACAPAPLPTRAAPGASPLAGPSHRRNTHAGAPSSPGTAAVNGAARAVNAATRRPSGERGSAASEDDDGGGAGASVTPCDTAAMSASALSALEQELSSGSLCSLDTTQLLKSFGCELDATQPAGGGSTRPPGAPVAPPHSLTGVPPHLFAPRGAAAPPSPHWPGSPRSPHPAAAHMMPPRAASAGDVSSVAAVSGVRAPRQRGAGAAVGGGGGAAPASPGAAAAVGAVAEAARGAAAAPIADEMLYRIERALSSGALRPQQATQLLSSYGYDLEKLFEQELGVGAAGRPGSATGGHSGGLASGQSGGTADSGGRTRLGGGSGRGSGSGAR